MSNEYNGIKILITGATGFIGSWISDYLLQRGAEVTTLIYNQNALQLEGYNNIFTKMKIVYGSIENYHLIERTIVENQIDTIFHIAAIPLQDLAYEIPKQTFDTNIRGTYHILEACRVHKNNIKRIIIASSDKVYGDSKVLPYTEDMPIKGKNPYDASKACTDILAKCYYYSYNLPIVIGRFGNIYGGRDLNFRRLIPLTIYKILNNEAPILRTAHKGEFKRDFLYVKDLVSAYILMFENLIDKKLNGQVFNFGTGNSRYISEVIKVIIKKCNSNLEPITKKFINAEILHQQVSSEKALKTLNWKPQYTFDDGIDETIEWYKTYYTK